MPQTKAHMKATNEWIKKNFYRFTVRMPLGHKLTVDRAAHIVDEGINEFINKAIDERIERIKKEYDVTFP